MKIYELLLIFLLIVSCDTQEKEESRARVTFEININPIAIGTDTLAKHQYEVFTFKNDKAVTLITYNNTNHSIEFFDLDSKIVDKRIYLESTGPKAIGDIKGLYYHNDDSIFVYSRGVITIIDDSYSKEANPNLFTFIENYDLNYEPIVNNHFRLYYLPEIKCIPLFNIYYDPKDKTSPKAEQISLFDLNNFKIKTLPYFQTEPIESDFEYGFLNYSTISQPLDGKFFMNQIYSPITYQYNAKTNDLKKVITTDKLYHKKNRNLGDWVPHAVESNFYNQMGKINDSTYIRILWNEAEYEPKENGFLKKEYILQIFDENFLLIDEIRLPNNTYYAYSWFVTNNKIYIQVGHPLYQFISEEELIIHEIELVSK